MKVEVARFGDLVAAQNAAKREIDAAAEVARGRYITLGAGQAMEYLYAYEEAKLKLSNPELPAPLLAADVAAGLQRRGTGLPVADELDAARGVVESHEAWLTVGAAIRQTRLAGKVAVEAAATEREVADLREATIAALAQI